MSEKNQPVEIVQSPFIKIDARSVIGFGMSGFLLWLLVKQSSLEWGQLKELFNTPRVVLSFCVASLLGLQVLYLQSVRTRIVFVDNETKLKDIVAFPSLVIGYFYNNVLPGNLGEAVRAFHFSRINNIRLSRAIAVVTLEKFLDSNIVLPFMLVTLLVVPVAGNIIVPAILIMAVLVFTGDVLLSLILRYKKVRRLPFMPIAAKKLRRIVYRIFIYHVGHLQRLWKNNTLKWYVITAFGMYLANGLQHFAILYGMNMPIEMFDFTTFNLLNLCVMLVAIIPSAPGNVGVAHYGLYVTLLTSIHVNHLQVDNSKLALIAIAIHFSYFIPEVLLGIVYVIKERKRLFGR